MRVFCTIMFVSFSLPPCPILGRFLCPFLLQQLLFYCTQTQSEYQQIFEEENISICNLWITYYTILKVPITL